MSLPPHLPNGAVPQVAPELASGGIEAMEAKAAAGVELEMDKARQIRQLRDRRVMETKQELNRIEQMGKVHRLLHQHIAAKIGRNLEAKFLNYGPLGKDKDTDLTSPLTGPKQIPPPPPIRIQADSSSRSSSSKRGASNRRRMKRSMKDWIVGRKNLGELSSSLEESQKKELEDIKGMQIVKNHLANRRKARSLANRMFNARVNNRRTKTSILLTGSEPDQQEMVEAMRHMNRFVIEKFLQTQSQNRRVLDRLNSIQMKAISDIVVGKAKGEPRRRSDSSIHEAMIVKEAEEQEKEEERKGVKRPHKRASFSSLSNLLERTGGTLKAKVEHGMKKLTHHSSPKRHSWKASLQRGATSNRKKHKGSRRLRWNRVEREKVRSYTDEDETFSKSSGTDEVDAASSPMFSGGGMTLEPLMERAALDTPASVKDQESAKSDKTISPMSSSGGAFQAYSSGAPPPPPPSLPPAQLALRSSQEDHSALTDQDAPISTASVAPSTSTATPLKGRATPSKHVPPPASPQSGPVQAPPTLTSPVTLPSPQEHHRAKQAPPTLKSAPPPFQAHGLPTTLNTSAMSTTTTQPGNILLADSPSFSMEPEFGAGTSAGYQADTEFQFEDLSELQDKPHVAAGSIFKSPQLLQAQLSTVSSEDCMHETPTKRARIEEESDNDDNDDDDEESAEFDDFQAPLSSPELQLQSGVVVKGLAENRMGGTEEYWSQGGRRDEGEIIIPMLVDADGPDVRRSEEVVLRDKGDRKNIRLVKSGRYYDMDDTSERDDAGERERRPVMPTRRVVHDQASTDSQEEMKDEDEGIGEVVKEKGMSSNYPESPKRSKNLSSRKSSSLELQPGGSSDTSTQAPSRVKRYFSTPTVSMDIENRHQIRPSFKPKASANRAYYTPIEVDEEFNPFNYEFEQDPDEVVPKSKRDGSSSGGGRIETDSASVPLSQRSPRAKPRRYDSSPRGPRMSPGGGQPQCRTAELKRKTIPPSAYDDPRFRQYLKTLSHSPTYDDYLSFRVVRRLVVIGDDIEVRYKENINNALDNIYMDIMKKTFSFENFSMIANRLLLESKRMQDRVFMIPLLARRLKEEVTPQMASAVGKYTELFMDNFVTNYLMSVGGWETIMESYEDVEVHDEHPANYIGEGGASVVFGDGEDLVYHLPKGGASNYDHLYDGGAGVPFDNHVYHPPPFQDHGLNMNEIYRQHYLDTYEENWPLPKEEEEEEEEAPLTKEEIFLSYLALQHPFLAEEPDYLRRVNSVEVLFQEKSDPSDDASDDVDYNNDIDENSINHTMPRRRKRSSQISLARSLSADSLASPGLGSGAFCPSPTASMTFLSRRISRSGASRNPAPPAESPTKRAPPSSHPPPYSHPHPHPHSPIMEQVDYPILQNPLQSGSTNNIISTSIPKGTQVRPPPISILVPNLSTSTGAGTANPPIQYPVSLSPPSPARVPSSQVSVSTSPSSVGPYYQVQSSGENYEHLYSDPSRSNSANSDTGSNVSKPRSNSGKNNGVRYQMKTDGKDKRRQPEARVGPPKWVVPVAIVTVGVAFLAGYFYLKRKS